MAASYANMFMGHPDSRLLAAAPLKPLSWFTLRSKSFDSECGTDGYVTIDSHCFKVHEESKTFDDAKSTCDMERGRMAVIDNQTTALALNDHIRANHTSLVGYLLGLTDREVEGEWRWENGDLLGDYPKFNRLQPNDNDRRYNNQGADCGYMSVVWHLLHKAIDQLYDDICSHPANFVCERVIV
ncbi:perlucin-like protein [Ylistrum balloti]|uniref:perlucin-like protein n=1 Tax=Ylistrum balloti TaxID=509963 RepID=UPI002905A113|nr:perlucin-like protein [Ylistrum balloti]